jgi:hypothetical protein
VDGLGDAEEELIVDRSDPAWQLADAALASMRTDPDTLEGVIRDLKPTARDMARAYTLCLTTPPFAQTEATRLILNSRLQVTLVEEHVAAQRRMGWTINFLTGVLVVLTVLLVIFGEFDLAKVLHESN